MKEGWQRICSKVPEYEQEHRAFCHLIDTPRATLKAQEKSIEGNFKEYTSPRDKYKQYLKNIIKLSYFLLGLSIKNSAFQCSFLFCF